MTVTGRTVSHKMLHCQLVDTSLSTLLSPIPQCLFPSLPLSSPSHDILICFCIKDIYMCFSKKHPPSVCLSVPVCLSLSLKCAVHICYHKKGIYGCVKDKISSLSPSLSFLLFLSLLSISLSLSLSLSLPLSLVT